MEENNFKTIIIIPTYNEAANIGLLIKNILSLELGLNILVVDDNSPDGTAGIVRNMQRQYLGINIIIRSRRLGLGSAYIQGFRYALEKGYKTVIQMDGDFSHQPAYIPKMLDLLKDYDFIIASRYVSGGGISDWSFVRVLLSKAANFFVRSLYNAPLRDYTSGFKVIKDFVLRDLEYYSLTSQGYFFQVEMVLRGIEKGHRIIEYPIVFQGRKNDKSKLTFSMFIEAFLKSILLRIKKVKKTS